MLTRTEELYRDLRKQLKRAARPNTRAFSKRMRVPYNTIRQLVAGDSLGTIRTWISLERKMQRLTDGGTQDRRDSV